jgi:hypothetical protein
VAGHAKRHAVGHIEERAAIVDLDDVVCDEADVSCSALLAGKAVAALDCHSLTLALARLIVPSVSPPAVSGVLMRGGSAWTRQGRERRDEGLLRTGFVEACAQRASSFMDEMLSLR